MNKFNFGPGEKKKRLAELIQAHIPGSVICANDLRRNFDSRITIDIYKWEGRGKLDGRDIILFSWDTMTDLVKKGIRIDMESYGQYEVSIKT